MSINCHGQNVRNNLLIHDLKEKIDEGIYPNIDGILVQLREDVIFEEYFNGFGRDSLHDTRSAFKSLTSLLAGIAIDNKLIRLNDSLEQFFPALKGKTKGNITIRDLLQMKSGLDCEEFYGIGPDCETEMWDTDDWIEYCLNVDIKDEPGLNWSYNSIEPMLVGEIISRVSKMTIMDFAEKNLFAPLGIEKYHWTITPKGRGMTAGSFFMRPIDMLKIIQLIHHEGVWGGKQIVSQEWIEHSTNCRIDIDFSFVRFSRMKNAKYETARYGYYWYQENMKYGDIETEILFASGNGGQYMIRLEEYNSLIVFTGSNFGNWRNKLPFEIILKYLIPIIENEN
jgi:CubicO group peptidase (beta-lactamase class C family)